MVIFFQDLASTLFFPTTWINQLTQKLYCCLHKLIIVFPHFLVQELSEEERETILMSEDFRQFFDHTSRVVERALDETDIDIDYSKSAEGEGSDK